MKKILILFVCIALLPLVSSSTLNWKIGDYWKYEITYVITHFQEERKYVQEMKVIGKENVSFYGKNYFAYKVEINESNETLLGFYRVGDLAYIGSVYDNITITVSEPPLEGYKFLETGKKWNQSVKLIQNVLGKIRNTSIVVYHKCLGKEKIKTRAGEFECYKIKVCSCLSNHSNLTNGYTIEYFSPSIKNVVLSISYRDGEIVKRKELIDTSYRRNHGTPSFTLFMLILSICIVSLLIRKKLRSS